MLTIAHRGAKGHAPENTLVAFSKALAMGADGIEFDVHVSADGEVIVIHDETVNRTSNGKGAVKTLTLPQLKRFRIDGGFEIPTLAEVLDLADRKCLVNVELKTSEATFPVLRMIEKYVSEKGWNYSDFLVSAFDWTALKTIREANPEIPLGVLTETDLGLAIGFASFLKAETIHPYFHLLDAENTAQMQQKGLKVFPWTINEPEDIARIKTYNTDGIITDFPDRI